MNVRWPPHGRQLRRPYLGGRLSSFARSDRKSVSCKLSGRVGLETICGHLNAQWLALAAYFPTPPFGMLTPSRSNDVIVVGIDRHTATLDPAAASQQPVVQAKPPMARELKGSTPLVDALEAAGITFLPANAQGVGLRGRVKS
jgi:hypothetical protein